MTAAFDIVDHDHLMLRVERQFGSGRDLYTN